MNNQQKGAKRDMLTEETLQEWGVMDVTQLQILLFPSCRVAQRRLARLVKEKRIKRCKHTVPYSYYIDDKPKNIIRRLEENWIRLWITKSRHAGERIVKYDYQTYIAVNMLTGTVKEYLIVDIKTPSVETIKEGLKCER